jgi:catechol 2,3-dioxygenase-like lactoylglutathione lyase family enzyme
MPLTELNHYFVRANDLERTKRFYCEVLGLQELGDRQRGRGRSHRVLGDRSGAGGRKRASRRRRT